jgi:hypothetical protein
MRRADAAGNRDTRSRGAGERLHSFELDGAGLSYVIISTYLIRFLLA